MAQQPALVGPAAVGDVAVAARSPRPLRRRPLPAPASSAQAAADRPAPVVRAGGGVVEEGEERGGVGGGGGGGWGGRGWGRAPGAPARRLQARGGWVVTRGGGGGLVWMRGLEFRGEVRIGGRVWNFHFLIVCCWGLCGLQLSKKVVNMGELRRLACLGVPDGGAAVRPLVWKVPHPHSLLLCCCTTFCCFSVHFCLGTLPCASMDRRIA